MVLFIHIALGLVSLAFSAYTALFPTKDRLNITYLLTLGTLTSGIVMVFLSSVSLGKACLSGVVYLGFVVFTSTLSHRRLAINYKITLV